MTVDDARDQVIEVAHAARGDDGDADSIRHRARQSDIETVLRAVAIHTGEQDFARAVLGHLARPLDHFESGAATTAVREHLPAIWRHALGVNGDDDALRAEMI